MSKEALLIGNTPQENDELSALLMNYQLSSISYPDLESDFKNIEKKQAPWIFINQNLAFKTDFAALKKSLPLTKIVVLCPVNSLLANEALQHSVDFYLSTPVNPICLPKLINEDIEQGELLCYYHLKSLEDASMLSNQISKLCPEPIVVAVGLSEILFNAIEHGNLDISYNIKSRLKDDGTWLEEVHRRLKLADNINKFVEISVRTFPERIKINIRDQGAGFNFEGFKCLDPIYRLDQHGRGIFMASNLAFSELKYLGCGNEVICSVNLKKP